MMDDSRVTTIAESEVRSFADVLERVRRGETVIITDDDVAVAEVRPLAGERPRPRRFVPTEEAQRIFADLPPVDYAAMRAEADALLGEDRI